MARIVYVGDEATALGFRLAGLDVRVCDAAAAPDVLRSVLAQRPDAVLVDSGLRVDWPPTDDAVAGTAPVAALVPDVRGRDAPPDLAQYVRNALGLES